MIMIKTTWFSRVLPGDRILYAMGARVRTPPVREVERTDAGDVLITVSDKEVYSGKSDQPITIERDTAIWQRG